MYVTRNGWTRETMKKRIREVVPADGSHDKENGGCLYRDGAGGACAMGAFILHVLPSSDWP